MEMPFEYINKGLRISKVADMLNIPRCSFYRNKPADKNNNKPVKRGRKNSEFTLRRYGNNTVVMENNTVVNDIKELLSGEFVCYGYKKTAKYLNRLIVIFICWFIPVETGSGYIEYAGNFAYP